MDAPWYKIKNPDDVPSPALLVYVERVDQNIDWMIQMITAPQGFTGGGIERLRPHVKTHKMAALVERQLRAGITKFKCATIAEAEMTARSGAPDVLLAMQPVGPNIRRLIKLIQAFPATRFSTILDNLDIARQVSAAATAAITIIDVFLDLDVGMHRTGYPLKEFTPAAVAFCKAIADLKGLHFSGLHAYDGHIHHANAMELERECDFAFAPVQKLADELRAAGLGLKIIVGGTPTFWVHAGRKGVECSPGTSVLYDVGYGRKFAEQLRFHVAAAVLTRVVSKPAPNLICLDLGHKSIASENPHPRAEFPDLPDAKAVTHSEEHLVLETAAAQNLEVGHVLYALPRHICPTVALYSEAIAVTDSIAGERWPVTARNRILTL
jgi:D-serine deaminase-like pyridoxal phosphate-dependent protein